MKINKIIERVTKYFKKDRLKNSEEEKILKIIDELKEKKANIKKELNEIIKCDIDKKNQLDKKLFAINKLIESAKELLKDK